MIHTIVTDCSLYRVNRFRDALKLRAQKRKALIYCCAITVCMVAAVYLWILV